MAEETGREAVRTAVRTGQSFIDTAEMYEKATDTAERLAGTGQVGSETVIGRALAGHPELLRDAFYATKVSAMPYTRARIRDAVAESLARLQTHEIDLFQLHSVDKGTP